MALAVLFPLLLPGAAVVQSPLFTAKAQERSVMVMFEPPLPRLSDSSGGGRDGGDAAPVMAKPSLFGVASYSAPISGQLVYASPNTRDGCRPIDPALVAAWPVGLPVVLMVDRGNCPFVAKMRHAQMVSGAANYACLPAPQPASQPACPAPSCALVPFVPAHAPTAFVLLCICRLRWALWRFSSSKTASRARCPS